MQKIEAQLSASLKSGLSSGIDKTHTANIINPDSKDVNKKSIGGIDTANSDKFVKSIGSLSDSIEKLTMGIKEGFKSGTKTEEKPEERKEGFVGDVKKLLAAVGIGAIIKQISDNEILAPARATGMLISSNVVSNPRQAGNDLLSSFQTRIANDTGNIAGGIGAAAGGILGSIIPGAGTLIGAGLGYAAGSSIGGGIAERNKATELPTLQRALTTDYYSSLSKQLPQYKQFGESQYGQKGFAAGEAFQDPYFESKAELGRSFSRFAGGNLNADVTSNILKSLTAQGASSPQELNITGNLLGQIARFTGKSSIDIEKVYKSVEKSGMNPNEGLQKTLSLLQSGLSIKEAENVIQKTSQRTEAFSAGQSSYLGATPFQQFSAQQAGKVTGVDTEKFFQGDAEEIGKARKIFREAAESRKEGRLSPASINAQLLESQQGITPAMADNNLKAAQGKAGDDYLSPSQSQQKILDVTQQAITKGAKGRGPEEIVDKALDEIGKSTDSFSGLKKASESLTKSFEDAAKSFGDFIDKHSKMDIHGNSIKPLTEKPR